MTAIKKQAITADLIAAMQREELHTREAAKYLNLNPCYLSMAQNSKSWDSMGNAPWVRLQEWWDTRDLLSKFQIPEGEEIWKPKEKPEKATNEKKEKKTRKVYRAIAESISEIAESEIAYRKVMEDHDKRVIERNEPDTIPEPLKWELKAIEPARIPITLDLKINIEIQLFGKTINIPLP